jgi:hypothetical protein
MMNDGFLSIEPIPAPAVKETPDGVRCDFFDLVRQSGMRNVVSTNDPPDIRVFNGFRDFKAVRPGRIVYCLADRNLPDETRDRAREIMRRLAYGFHDWAAREIVARYHRDVKQALAGAEAQNSESMGELLKIKRFIRGNPGATVAEISNETGLKRTSVVRAVAQWQNSGRLQAVGNGSDAQYYLNEEYEEEPKTVDESVRSPMAFQVRP